MAIARSPLSFIGRRLLISLGLWCVFSAAWLKLIWIYLVYQNEYYDPLREWWEGTPPSRRLTSFSALLDYAWWQQGWMILTALWIAGTVYLIGRRLKAVRRAYADFRAAQRVQIEAHRVAAEEQRKRDAAAAAARLQQDRQNHAAAGQQRQRRLAQLEDEVLNLWTDFELSRDFAGRLNPDELRREFRRRLADLGVPDIGLLRESVSPRVRDVVGNGRELPPGPAPLPPPP